MIMQSNNNHQESHHNDTYYGGERQYDAYMYAEYGIEC
ncbi:hypothetical protein F7D08_0640 [Bifidobacterium cebidarum]|uniref:Uncharacterized protein n=1 Tax=Bifidobacterium cebidarum TaxID=2650773 RepID=A0A6I1GGW3_9BIFI|nr:hypothetical protein F7D08_0640 [Bifidobacterium cebidarum]